MHRRDSSQDLKEGLEPFSSPLPLSGIARMASQSDLADEKNDVQYFSLPSKSILNRCSNPSMPFQWTINPYRGCEFGCKYCYARYTHEFMELRNGIDFEKKIYAKEEVSKNLRRELTPHRVRDAVIAIGTATDPYQPAEREFKVTRQILETLTMAREVQFSITTKSDLVLRDLDLLRKAAKTNRVRVNLSITTTDERLARLMEPRAPRPALRFKAVRTLVDNGISAGVFMMPLLPEITTSDENMESVVRTAALARAEHLFAGVVFLMPSAQKQFFPFLDRHFPELTRRYRRMFARSAYLPEDYTRQIQEKVHRLREKHGIPHASNLKSQSHEEVAQQLDLEFM
ncbi:MAG: radical SAM protein [Acidobacteriia bacterium]|nr:radical SAM protein [Terriglobia bacterium]